MRAAEPHPADLDFECACGAAAAEFGTLAAPASAPTVTAELDALLANTPAPGPGIEGLAHGLLGNTFPGNTVEGESPAPLPAAGPTDPEPTYSHSIPNYGPTDAGLSDSEGFDYASEPPASPTEAPLVPPLPADAPAAAVPTAAVIIRPPAGPAPPAECFAVCAINPVDPEEALKRLMELIARAATPVNSNCGPINGPITDAAPAHVC